MTAFVINGLTVTLDGQRILDDTHAEFGAGIHAVVGRSGAGKSVLLKAACGLLPSVAGRIHFPSATGGADSCDVTDADAFARLRQSVSFVHQDPALLDELSVIDNLDFVLRRRTPLKAAARAADIHASLDGLGLAAISNAKPRDLPPGLCRQVALARALLLKPRVLIADEPTTGLDPAAARDVDRALLTLAKDSDAILIVITHDLRSLSMLEPRLHLVHRGRVSFHCPFDDRFDADVPPVLRAILTATPFDGPVGLETVDSPSLLAGLAP